MADPTSPLPSDRPDSSARFCIDFSNLLRERRMSLRRAEELSGWSKSSIGEAGKGPNLPNAALVTDVLGALALDQDEIDSWLERHRQLSADQDPTPRRPSRPAQDSVEPLVNTPAWARSTVLRRMVVGLAVFGVLAVLGGLAGAVLIVLRSGTPAVAAEGRTVVVQNKVAFGPSELVEDRSPSYLGARPVALCANQPGCKLEGTDVWSGDTLLAVCQLQATLITNANVGSPNVRSNPNATASTLWYGIRWPDGRRGYISEVYIAPTYRGGLNLPQC